MSCYQGNKRFLSVVMTPVVCSDDVTSWFPGLQLSVFVFLRVVVSPLGLVGQLSAVLGLVVVVSSALRVRRPEGGLLLGVRAGTDHTHAALIPLTMLILNNLQNINKYVIFIV